MEFKKLSETKVLKDPVHSYIHINYEVVWNCLDSKEFQRLRRIRQLGGDFQVYPTAEHSRFSHSLGVYEIVRRMVTEIKSLSVELSEYDKICVMLAGLLHDVGHGPFSHAFEHVTKHSHEDYTAKIILGETELNQVLTEVSPRLPEDIVSIIEHNHPNDILNQIISGQLDADRMDYLLRDSYFSATSYGQFDLERILRTMRVRKIDENKKALVVKYTGIHSVEDYIMARYQMYWQVYYHPVARSYEAVFIQLFNRLKDIFKENKEYFSDMKVLIPFLEKNVVSVEEYFKLDENSLLYCCSLIQDKDDEIAADLARRLQNRRLFEYVDYSEENLAQIKNMLKEQNLDEKYYLRVENVEASVYSPYKGRKILIEQLDGKIVALEKASTIVESITKGETKREGTIFYPR
ncbi:deoxyguanosinetriphosphate triphosphohydrolase-like protein [Gemella morbillorum]|uniref:HD domain-containing protein n=1 Tax=Gemella morbillorum TaxID=29391 RepID=UPI000DA3D2B5|nr:HD domain-containing protein [Gemella morbillorum]UBH80637.1 HD domain-containing protein [Gemella morbillorum]SQH56037.1 deoxyguanosinetriphosphate triphosphohydrolase-like protein [Gemella morbillorum]